jgi:hypothetical protein
MADIDPEEVGFRNFLELEFESDPTTLAQGAVDVLLDQWPDWDPNEGDLEVVLIESIAPMASDAAIAASQVPTAIFQKFGTDLFGLPFSDGAPARLSLLFTIDPSAGDRVIPAGSEIDVDGFAFQVDDDFTVPGSSTTAGPVPATATDVGADANGLTGDHVAIITALTFVLDTTLSGASSGGVDPEEPDDYVDRLARHLQLQSVSLVTTRDYELMALDDPRVGRVVALNDGTRAVRVVATDSAGELLDSATKAALVATYAEFRLVNVVVTVADPTYTTVNVAYEVRPYPNFDPTDLVSRLNEMLAGALSPAGWGIPSSGDSQDVGWVNDPLVRKNKIIDLMSGVEGVNYIGAVTITGSAGTVSGGDLTMPGIVALPRPGTFTGTVLTS